MPDERKRNYNVIIYPEHFELVELYKFLTNTHIPCALSPIHDPDPDEGNLKKHMHLTLCYGGKVSLDEVKHTFDPISGGNCPTPEACKSLRGSIRYLIHKDNPEKQQFPDTMPITFNGLDIEKYFKSNSNNNAEIITCICSYNAVNMTELCYYLIADNKYDELSFCIKHAYFVQCLLK